ncbi:MAG: hypothetical protein LBH29_04325 [Elusimicrobiota bacterium]|jgi:hypothetical protein|nr:hypothetical protein [Elusimicrobiota bacterium]
MGWIYKDKDGNEYNFETREEFEEKGNIKRIPSLSVKGQVSPAISAIKTSISDG